MVDVLLLTPREVATGGPALNNQNVVINDEEYARLGPAMRLFYEKIRENLGIACLTGELRAKGYDVAALNLHGRMPSDAAIVDLVREHRPRVVGLSVMYDLHVVDAVRLLRCVREAAPDALVAMGGAFCTYNAELLAESLPGLDAVAFGEGEVTVVELVEAFDAGRPLGDVRGLVVRDGDGVRSTGPPRLPDLTTIAWPARDVLVRHRASGIPTPVASTYTSRGCHAKCTFCYAPRQPGVGDSGPWRVRPPEDVVDEIEFLQRDFGTRFLWFNDDNFGGAFSDGLGHAVAFAEEMIRRGLKVPFHCELRVDSGLVDADALATLKRAGLTSALLGIESGSPEMLRRFRKGVTVPYNVDAARLFKDAGVTLDPGWIMIEPRTTFDELWEDLLFIVTTRIHDTTDPFLLVNRAIALRGTEMYDAVTDPLPPPPGVAGPAGALLGKARREYAMADRRIDALWTCWSETGGRISDQRENEAPFLGRAIVDAVRGGAGPDARRRLPLLRRWQSGLADLFVAMLNHAMLLAASDPDDLEPRLRRDLTELVDAYETETLEQPFAAFAADVTAALDRVRPVPA
jgi:radical SAM superfamily enzyme YgiQ (UPF0313 family)